MTQTRLPCAVLGALGLLALAILAPTAQAHSTYEAAELEVQVLDDEGSDLIEAYGGYDIQDVFVGFAHMPEGPGPARDGLYFRVELYGNRTESVVPQDGANWTVDILFSDGGEARTVSIWTLDGVEFHSTAPTLLAEVDDRDVHVQRAFLGYGAGGLREGGNLTVLRVESRVGGDLRDVAPGGIPVPGTNGAREYEDPGAIPGKGAVNATVPLRASDIYLRLSAEALAGGGFEVTVASALKHGGQHVFVSAASGAAGEEPTVDGERQKPLDPNQTLRFRVAGHGQPYDVAVSTDVGGFALLHVGEDGVLIGPQGLRVEPAPQPEAASPGPALAVLLVALGGAGVVRRRRGHP